MAAFDDDFADTTWPPGKSVQFGATVVMNSAHPVTPSCSFVEYPPSAITVLFGSWPSFSRTLHLVRWSRTPESLFQQLIAAFD